MNNQFSAESIVIILEKMGVPETTATLLVLKHAEACESARGPAQAATRIAMLEFAAAQKGN